MQKALKSRVLTLVSTRWGLLVVVLAACWSVTSTIAMATHLLHRGQAPRDRQQASCAAHC
jgi:hypothetical protein